MTAKKALTITDLREHLFATLDALRDPDRPLDIDRAHAVCAVAQAVIATAKVEVEFAKATGQSPGTDFLPTTAVGATPTPPTGFPPGIVGVRQHRIAG
jgi:hypothetical protein